MAVRREKFDLQGLKKTGDGTSMFDETGNVQNTIVWTNIYIIGNKAAA